MLSFCHVTSLSKLHCLSNAQGKVRTRHPHGPALPTVCFSMTGPGPRPLSLPATAARCPSYPSTSPVGHHDSDRLSPQSPPPPWCRTQLLCPGLWQPPPPVCLYSCPWQVVPVDSASTASAQVTPCLEPSCLLSGPEPRSLPQLPPPHTPLSTPPYHFLQVSARVPPHGALPKQRVPTPSVL